MNLWDSSKNFKEFKSCLFLFFHNISDLFIYPHGVSKMFSPQKNILNWNALRHDVLQRIVGKKEDIFTMATGTPLVLDRQMFCFTLFYVIHTHLFHCQQFLIPFKDPSGCGVNEFFDISSLSCAKCGANQRKSSSGGYRSPRDKATWYSVHTVNIPTLVYISKNKNR